ncbi:MAG: protease-4 [Sphingobacteriales bacterium]|jgi:protease-4
MGQFFKFLFASILGVIIGFFLLFIILISIGAAVSSSPKAEIKSNSILKLDLNAPMLERSGNDPFSDLDIPGFPSSSTVGLDKVLAAIKNAKTDEKIEGIYLPNAVFGGSFAQAEEVRNALISFKESGKFIVSYSEVYTQKAYYLASVADSIWLNPAGYFDFKGLSTVPMFFKGMLDKLEIDAQIIKVGNYKSAAEPFIRKDLSEYNKEQISSFLGSMYTTFISGISASRGISEEELRAISNELKVRTPLDAVAQKLVDKLYYEDQVLASLSNLCGVESEKKMKFVSVKKYNSAISRKGYNASKNKVAVIYASGQIIDGESTSDEQFMGSKTLAEEIRKARKDDKIKAIVLRVNSPGGSALASDVMCRELKLASQVKPLVVSMGGVAASGGYYISAPASKIFAQPNTITGSIGVIGIIPNMKGFFNNKLGITFDEVKTGKYADYLTGVGRPLREDEKAILQASTNKVYEDFTSVVAEGRNIPQDRVKELGGGRVYSGTEALTLGLVDEIGGLEDAINEAVKQAELSEYKIISLPVQKDPIQEMMKSMGNVSVGKIIEWKLGEDFAIYHQIEKIRKISGIQAIMPMELDVN